MKRGMKAVLGLILVGVMLVAYGCGKDSSKKEPTKAQVKDELTGFNAAAEIEKLKGADLAAKVSKNIEEGYLKRAAAVGKEAWKKEPKNLQLLMNLSVVYMYQENYRGMVEVMRKAKEIAPNNPVVLNQLAWALIESKENVDEGVKLTEQALKSFNRPDKRQQSVPYLDTYAYGLYKQGKYEQAIAVWENILPNVQSGEIYIHLARAYEAKNAKVRAKETYKKALSFLELEIKDANIIQVEKQRLQRLEKATQDALAKLNAA